jgi:sugar lactone lactonase YvrE
MVPLIRGCSFLEFMMRGFIGFANFIFSVDSFFPIFYFILKTYHPSEFCMNRKIKHFIGLVFFILHGSPFFAQQPSEDLVAFIARFGEKGDGPGQFNSPQAVSVDPSGFLYVADTGNNRIQKFDFQGRFVAEIGGFGWGREQFNEPVSVWAENGLDVFVADYDNQRIERYDKDLHYIGSMQSSDEWPVPLQFGYTLDVRFTAQSELFCLDGENQRVLKMDVFGNPQISFGGYDSGEGRLVNPRRLLVSTRNRVYVSDEEGGRIVVFDTYGNYLTALGGFFEKPGGMAEAATRKLLFAADSAQRRIHIFLDLKHVGSFGDEAVPGVRFEAPADIAWWNGFLYVLDKTRCEIFTFKWLGPAGESSL